MPHLLRWGFNEAVKEQSNRAEMECQAEGLSRSAAALELPGDSYPVGVDGVRLRPVNPPVGVGAEVVTLGLE